MTDQMARNLLLTIGTMLAGAFAAALAALLVQLSGTDPITWRPVVAAAIGPIVTGLLAMQLPRSGDEALSAQSDALKANGIPRHEQMVVSQDEAVQAIGATGSTLPTADAFADAVVARIEAKMRAAPADPGSTV